MSHSEQQMEQLLETAVAIGARAGIDKLAALVGSEAVVSLIEAAKPSAIGWVARHVKDLVPDRVVDIDVVAGAQVTGRVTFDG